VDVRLEDGPRGDRIVLRVALGGPLGPEQAARIRQIASRCPVHRMLAGAVTIAEETAPPGGPPVSA
jgi:uncharacterized OsmC-like protein